MACSFVSSMKIGRADKFLGDREESAYIMSCLCPYPTHQESNETLGEPEVNPMPWLALSVLRTTTRCHHIKQSDAPASLMAHWSPAPCWLFHPEALPIGLLEGHGTGYDRLRETVYNSLRS
jgi:hypothetical protein